jgi:hypothetical protein
MAIMHHNHLIPGIANFQKTKQSAWAFIQMLKWRKKEIGCRMMSVWKASSKYHPEEDN